ncbi:translation-associated GTPase [Waddlia chondrophila WSU 86-1044]|uniref:Ribosome-binding ATPase YchF n=2 Tax=Waddlia chondrophila TaxID=71667 RepID=D6YVQ6_WADCW|nr:translation-associated GTPase [Waddlia chondrophila WSU 86-1044]
MMSSLSCGIVGLPNVGKSSLFNALTANEAPSSNFPFCTIDPNVGIVEVYDNRLEELAKISKSGKTIHAAMQFVDIAGIVEGASKGEGLGNKFLANIRETDAILHVVRCFDDSNITHVSGSIDPIRDIEVINLELMLADLQSVESMIPKVEKKAKGDRKLMEAVECLKRVQSHLNQNQPVRILDLSEKEKELLKPYPFLTQKQVLYVCNVAEDSLPSMDNPYVQSVKEHAKNEGSSVVTICARIEEEIAQLSKEDQLEFLGSVGLTESGLQRLVKASFEMLGLITFLTTGEMETRAWTIPKGFTAQEAAGKIHTDIMKGFIRAEVVAYDDMIEFQGRVGAREKGKARSEGKEYIVKDGDVILFLHH